MWNCVMDIKGFSDNGSRGQTFFFCCCYSAFVVYLLHNRSTFKMKLVNLLKLMSASVITAGIAVVPFNPSASANITAQSQKQSIRNSVPIRLAQARGQRLLAVLPPNAGRFNITIQNNTRSPVYLQAIGYSNRILLSRGRTTTFRNIPIPVTLVMTRQDGGLINAQSLFRQYRPSRSVGISLNNSRGLGDSQLTIRAENSRRVIAY